MEKQPCVYMMASRRHGTLYIGVTSNLVGRILQHREGRFDGFSKRYGCVRLVWFAVADTMEAAITREKQMKKWNRDWKARLIEEDNPQWDDLAIGLGLPPFIADLRSSEEALLDSRLRGNDI
ncbi:MAG: GIY-YIG nuclease family protein [Sphingomonas sp.]|uniref:GIY-YIG nuclease family protein n=1 Tax=Sphingomonas sp. TaxID=28214 RepID=UPI001AD18742|nr:GIY-YIG nuclease family protein [Sphingomonas sp.]MBN8809237.1 GIY-YIG nuclease family protein [Sphingomonas sp.]